MRRLFRTNLKLWVGLTAALVAALVAALSFRPVVYTARGEVLDYWMAWEAVLRGGSFRGTPARTAVWLVDLAVKAAIMAAVVGWVVQRVVLAAVGLRARGHAEPGGAADPGA